MKTKDTVYTVGELKRALNYLDNDTILLTKFVKEIGQGNVYEQGVHIIVNTVEPSVDGTVYAATKENHDHVVLGVSFE